jgi:hypothetical protein
MANQVCTAPAIPITKSTYMERFALHNNISSSVPPDTVIRADGTVDTAELNTFVNTFLSQVPPPLTIGSVSSNENTALNFSSRTSALRNAIKEEYCWYYHRYIWGLTNVLTSAAQSGGVVDEQVKTNTAILNNKLNGILLVMKSIANSRINTLSTYYANGVNSQNATLNTARSDLQKHSEILRKNDLQSDVQSAMIDYSIEKNTTSRNLLAVYGFMNIVAVGLLFYLYTNIKE